MVELVKMLSRTHRNIWLAGDDDQSIHGFRGARSDILISFGQELGAQVKSIAMSYNYRSTQNIIQAANNLIAHNRVRIAKEMTTDNDDGYRVEIVKTDNELIEAQLIAQKLLELIETGYHYREMAVLVRVYRLMPLIEAALIKDKIPYTSSGGWRR